ncbi:F0F1 ATP synthase subunit B [Halomonas sp. YLGW01]|uniref:F0F1 ATP synthase subunit B family protein n=1 Tax=Halomonas sp. YLGW01 TaxID=2773308 RepID=UPI0017820F06|nr:F0F1 ATP synthase subunit B [Halomonas sp. YLGW01]
MLIDWFTVLAQVLNFAILVWLMKRFLYQPILNAIDARESRIAATLADADARQAEADEERERFHARNAELEAQRTQLLATASEEAAAERARLIEEARQAADAMRDQRQSALRTEAQRLNQALRRQTQDEVFAMTRQALGDMADEGLEARLVAVFLKRLATMDEATAQRFGAALEPTASKGASSVRVRSAFPLPKAQQAAIQEALARRFPQAFSPDGPAAGTPIAFQTAPELISGIELTANGQQLAWSLEGYLDAQAQAVAALLEDRVTPDAAS